MAPSFVPSAPVGARSSCTPPAPSSSATFAHAHSILETATSLARSGYVSVLDLQAELAKGDIGPSGELDNFFAWLFASLSEDTSCGNEVTAITLVKLRLAVATYLGGSQKSPRALEQGLNTRGRAPKLHDRKQTRSRSPSVSVTPPPPPQRKVAVFAPRNRAFQSTQAALKSVPFLVRWINFLCGGVMGWTPLTPDSFFEDLRNGVVLCSIVGRLVPSADFSGISTRTNTRALMQKNLECALSVVWKQGVNAHRMCTSEHFLDLNIKKVTGCMVEIFEVVQMRNRDIRVKAIELMGNLHKALSQTEGSRNISDATRSDPLGNEKNLLDDFADCSLVMRLLVHVGAAPPKNLLLVRGFCVTQEHLLEQGAHLNRALARCACPIFLSPSEWSKPITPFPDALIFQLNVIWQFLSRFQKDVVPRRMAPESKEDQVKKFIDFMLKWFTSLDIAYRSMVPHKGNRVSHTSFMKSLRSMAFPGDAKFIWHCLDKRGSGWLSVDDLKDLAKSVGVKPNIKLQSNMDTTLSPMKSEHSSEGALCLSDLLTDRDDRFDRPLPPGSPSENFSLRSPASVSLGSPLRGLAEDAEEGSGEQPTVKMIFDFFDNFEEPDAAYGGVHTMALAFKDSTIEERGVRFLATHEETEALFLEDSRRVSELYELGQVVAARRATEAASNAFQAASAAIAQELLNERLDPTRLFEKEEEGECDEEGGGEEKEEPLDIEPTTSIEGTITLSNCQRRKMFLRTAVVEVPQAFYAEDDEDAPEQDELENELVLEVRDIGPNKKLRLQILVRLIDTVDQLGAATTSYEDGEVPFVVSFAPSAVIYTHEDGDEPVLCNPVFLENLADNLNVPLDRLPLPSDVRRTAAAVRKQREHAYHYHATDIDSNLLLRVSAGPSPWRRCQAARFFDELRILAHFLKQPPEQADAVEEGE